MTEFVAGRAEDSLRLDMERLAATGEMSGQLSSEIMSYAMCKLDDTWAEAAHRDVSGQGKRSPASRTPNIAASQRLGQNLAMVDSLEGSALEFVHRAFRCWKAIGQRSAKKARSLQPRRMSDKAAQRLVYRFDGASQCSWGLVLGEAKPGKSVTASVMLRLQVEWLSAMVPEGDVLSYPVVSDDVLSELRTVCPAEASARLSAVRTADRHTFFVLADKRA